jgi:ADP-ribose pyrophosphatase
MPHPSSDELLFVGRRFRIVRLLQKTADGAEHVREVMRHPGAVAVVPVLPGGRICLLRNYRAGVAEHLVEIPAGTLEPGEEPLETARRELAEETGYRAGRLEPLCTFYTSPGILDEIMHVYLATELAEGPASPEPGEELQVLVASWDEVEAMIRRGEIRDGKSLTGLLYYDRFARQAASP